MARTPLKVLRDVAIEVDESGVFYAVVDGKTLSRKDLRALEREITARTVTPTDWPGMRVVRIGEEYGSNPTRVEVLRAAGVRKDAGRRRYGHEVVVDAAGNDLRGNLYAGIDDAAVERLRAVLTEIARLRAEREEIMRAGHSVYPHNVAAALARWEAEQAAGG